MNNHIYHSHIKLTVNCKSCNGMGQLKIADFPKLVKIPSCDIVPLEVNNITTLIVMCDECVGHGIVLDDKLWSNFKTISNPDVVFLAEQFIEEHLKPGYLS